MLKDNTICIVERKAEKPSHVAAKTKIVLPTGAGPAVEHELNIPKGKSEFPTGWGGIVTRSFQRLAPLNRTRFPAPRLQAAQLFAPDWLRVTCPFACRFASQRGRRTAFLVKRAVTTYRRNCVRATSSCVRGPPCIY